MSSDGTQRPRLLQPRHDLHNHSSSFDWGADGPGAAQLALAILADYLGDGDLALKLHEGFKVALIAALPHRAWALGDDAVGRTVRQLQR